MPDTNDTLSINRDELQDLNDRAEESAALRRAVKRVKFWGGVAFACATTAGVAWNFAEASGRDAAIEEARKEAVNGKLKTNADAIGGNATAIGLNAKAIGDNATKIDTAQAIGVETYEAVRKLDRRNKDKPEPPSVTKARADLNLPKPPG